MRIKAKWAKSDIERSLQESASVLGFNYWKLAADFLLDLENEGFQVDTYAQRLDIMAEALAYVLQLTDRMVYEQLDDSERATLIRALGIHLMETMQDNRIDAQGEGNYRDAFVQLLNDRADTYAACSFEAGEPSFVFRRNFGNSVRDVIGETDRKWVPDYVMDIKAPDMLKTIKRVLSRTFPDMKF